MLRAAEAWLGADGVLGPARSDGGSSEGVWAAPRTVRDRGGCEWLSLGTTG